MALSDDAAGLSVQLDRRDRGGTRTTKQDAGAAAAGVSVPSLSLLQLLEKEQVSAIDALKIDVEGFEDVILAPFFRNAPDQLLPRLIIIEDCRGSWKADLMSIMIAKGYTIVTRSKLNFMLRLSSR
jgi:FkbM family methyltransferase